MITLFNIGDEGSKSKLTTALSTLIDKGAGILNSLESFRLNLLTVFDRRLSAVNARRFKSFRVKPVQVASKLVVSDFLDIDQASTTGTVRIDSGIATLRERSIPTDAVIKNKTFTSNTGTIELLDPSQTIYRVHTDDSSTPTGQFDIELVNPLVISHLIIDIVATPSSPTIQAFASGDGLTYTESNEITLLGYRLNITFPTQITRFIRLSITPSHPDDLNGNTFSFGVTDFHGQATEYHLRADVVSKVVSITPKSDKAVFEADDDPSIQYFLSMNSDPYVEVKAQDTIQIAGVSSVVSTGVSMSNTGLINHTLPTDVYLSTLKVTESTNPIRIAPGLSQSDPNISALDNEYVGINTSTGVMKLVRSDSSYNPTRIFDVSYTHGPASVNAILKVRLSTDNQAITPIFHGAALNEV